MSNHYVACPKCRSNGKDTKGDNLQIYEDGHGYCHSCSYYLPSPNLSRRLQKRQEQLKKVSGYLPLPLPENYQHLVPSWVDDWLAKYQLDRKHFPNSYYSTDFEGSYVFLVGNTFFARCSPDNSFGGKYIGNPSPTLLKGQWNNSHTLVIVEDYLSGYKLSRLKGVDSLVLFGTKINNNLFNNLKGIYNKYYLWLDNDALNKSISYIYNINNIYNININIINTIKDSKYYNYNNIYKLLYNII